MTHWGVSEVHLQPQTHLFLLISIRISINLMFKWYIRQRSGRCSLIFFFFIWSGSSKLTVSQWMCIGKLNFFQFFTVKFNKLKRSEELQYDILVDSIQTRKRYLLRVKYGESKSIPLSTFSNLYTQRQSRGSRLSKQK